MGRFFDQGMEKEIKEFFDAYEKRFNRALAGEDDIEGTAGAFADSFIGASPAGVTCGANNEDFRKNIPIGNAFYRNIGTRLMTIKQLQITELNEQHYLAKAYWHSEYEQKDGRRADIDFDVFYLLQYRNADLRIFAYVTGDEQAVLREHGLIS